MKGYSEDDLKNIHQAIAKALIEHDKTHYYETWDSDLDESLPEDIKEASEGYYKKEGSILGLDEEEAFAEDEHYETEYKYLLEEFGVIELWEAPKKRSKVPADHFLDPGARKYPYKNPDGSINCQGLKSAIAYAGGARGAPKRPGIAAKGKKIYAKNCAKKKAELVGNLVKIGDLTNP